MRIHLGVVAVVSLYVLTVCSKVGDAGQYGGAGAGSPIRSATAPISSYQSGLIGRPNPLNGSGNQVVTGNVGSGKHFRGPVPYRSTTSMNAPLGSTSLDSFMRYTTPQETRNAATGTYGSFYSPTRTVTSMSPGTRSVSTPPAPRVGAGAMQSRESGSTDVPYSDLRSRSLLPTDAGSVAAETTLDTVPRLRLWPLSEATEGASPVTGDPLFESPPAPSRRETVTGRDYQQQMEALQQRLRDVKAELSVLEQSLAVADEPSQSAPERSYSGVNEARSLLPSSDAPRPTTGQTSATEAGSSRSRRDELLEETARLLAATTGLPAPGMVQDETAPMGHGLGDASLTGASPGTRLRLYRPETGLASIEKVPGRRRLAAVETPTDLLERPDELRASGVQLDRQRKGYEGQDPSPAPEPAAPPPTVGETVVVQPSVQDTAWRLDQRKEKVSYSPEAFERHLQAGRQHARQGRYAQAADAFTLASAYRPNDPQSYLGKSHALLAAGEYMGSALALAKAVELDPQYALRKVNLVWIAGGPDAFIARFNALDEAGQEGVTPHLEFLLAYIYYQMERPDEARAAIDVAQRALPSSRFVDLLKAAIDQ